MPRLTAIFLVLALSLSSSYATAERLLSVKYRSTPVDVDKPYFESIDTSKSSLVNAAWYDAKNQYMVINLSGTNYHYCGLDAGTWKAFKASDSFGASYTKMIKGKFDCRVYPVPDYK